MKKLCRECFQAYEGRAYHYCEKCRVIKAREQQRASEALRDLAEKQALESLKEYDAPIRLDKVVDLAIRAAI
jgi:hypothetical protein